MSALVAQESEAWACWRQPDARAAPMSHHWPRQQLRTSGRRQWQYKYCHWTGAASLSHAMDADIEYIEYYMAYHFPTEQYIPLQECEHCYAIVLRVGCPHNCPELGTVDEDVSLLHYVWTILEIWCSAVKQPQRPDCDCEQSVGVLSSLWFCGMVGQVSSWSVLPLS